MTGRIQPDPAEPDEVPTLAIQVVRGTATDEEVAALMAVVSEAYVTETEHAVAPETPVSAWERTQRAIRTPLRRDIGWGRFVG